MYFDDLTAIHSTIRLKQLEKGFVLDGVPLSKLANDEIGRTHPSLNIGIPQYSALYDPGCKQLFATRNKPKTANEPKEHNSSVIFMQNSSSQKYMNDRKKIGAGICLNVALSSLAFLICMACRLGHHSK